MEIEGTCFLIYLFSKIKLFTSNHASDDDHGAVSQINIYILKQKCINTLCML